jgi:choline transport protein
LIGSAVVLQQVSFLFPAILLVCRRRNEAVLPKDRAFALPNAVGWAVNLFAIAFMAVTTIVFMLPAQLPATASNMSMLIAYIRLNDTMSKG